MKIHERMVRSCEIRTQANFIHIVIVNVITKIDVVLWQVISPGIASETYRNRVNTNYPGMIDSNKS